MKKLIPFLVLLVLILIVYVTDLHKILTLEWLRKEELRLSAYAKAHPILAPLLYLAIYISSVCLVIPDSTILTLLGAMIFSLPEGFLLALFSETVGATLFFAIFHGLFSTALMQREHPFMSKLRKGFTKYSISYMLFLRFSHVVPFWLTNVSAAYFRVSYLTFIWTTFVGVIPLTYIIADAGSSLSQVFASKKVITLSDIFTMQVKVALIALGLLALVPIIYKKWISKKK